MSPNSYRITRTPMHGDDVARIAEVGALQLSHDEAGHRRAATGAVAFSAAGLALTGGIEMALAIFTGSVALLGDALHNLADVSTSAVVFLGFFVSRRPPSARYPYGYERAEDLAGLGVALVIFASAIFAGAESYRKLISGSGTQHLYVAMGAAVIGMAGNFAVSRYKRHVARKIQSVTMEADATHSWLDMLSSAGALVGLIGVRLGYKWADPLAGFVVMLFILHVAYEVTKEIIEHLMDGVDPQHLAAAERAVDTLPEITQATVRGRWTGRSLIIEVEGGLEPRMRLHDAQALAPAVEAAVRGSVEEVRRVVWIPRPADG